MRYTRFSLYYLATYLNLGGLGFLFLPKQFSSILLANTFYEDIPLRLAGMFSLLLGIVVIQIIRYKIEVLYETSVLARVIGIITLASLYFLSDNTMFVTLQIIVGVGLLITIFGWLVDKKVG